MMRDDDSSSDVHTLDSTTLPDIGNEDDFRAAVQAEQQRVLEEYNMLGISNDGPIDDTNDDGTYSDVYTADGTYSDVYTAEGDSLIEADAAFRPAPTPAPEVVDEDPANFNPYGLETGMNKSSEQVPADDATPDDPATVGLLGATPRARTNKDKPRRANATGIFRLPQPQYSLFKEDLSPKNTEKTKSPTGSDGIQDVESLQQNMSMGPPRMIILGSSKDDETPGSSAAAAPKGERKLCGINRIIALLIFIFVLSLSIAVGALIAYQMQDGDSSEREVEGAALEDSEFTLWPALPRIPTPVPTANVPSPFPTALSLASPTGTPTFNPTSAPVDDMTFSPTSAPADDMTGIPVGHRTSFPSLDNSVSITNVPTSAPPSSSGTSPSMSPTPGSSLSVPAETSLQPSRSLRPTHLTSSEPTVSSRPTPIPTTSPTTSRSPTWAPTERPSTSSSPVSLSSFAPSASKSPVSDSSGAPSYSSEPTLEPTATPTITGTESPTEEFLGETSVPTYEPTPRPTRRPTPRPTRRPTRPPTPRPTLPPTPRPTRRPTRPPTPRPTRPPAPRPTRPPTPRPTRRPTPRPTRRPTPRPTRRPTPRPTRRPTPPPVLTFSPTRSPVASASLRDLIIEASPSTASAFSDRLSPQNLALSWMEDNPSDLADWKLLQRWTLVAFAYSTNVFSWNIRNNWLEDGVDECSAFGVECNDSGRVVAISLSSNGMTGTLLPELFLLADSLLEFDVSRNLIRGTLPATFGRLRNLRELELQRNRLQGNIPTQMGRLVDLEIWYFEWNQFDGNVPNEIARLTNLEELVFHANDLTGAMTEEVCDLPELTRLELDCREVDIDCWTRCWYQCGGTTGVPCP